MNHGNNELRIKMKKKEKKKRPSLPMGNNLQAGAVSVVSIIISLKCHENKRENKSERKRRE